MLLEESLWIKSHLEQIPLQPGQICVDVASSTLKFRTIDQPYIQQNVFEPLRQRGLTILHLDRKEEEGVDLNLDINTTHFRNQFNLAKPHLVICTSLLEHIQSVDLVLSHLNWVTQMNGFLLLSVPSLFGFHPDPIDTMYRPTPKKLIPLLEKHGFSVVSTGSVTATSWPTYLGDVLAGYFPFRRFPRFTSSRRLRKLTFNLSFPSKVSVLIARKDKEC